MDSTSFFNGLEVGRAMRGWRTPGEARYPSGTKTVRSNGEYDVANYETLDVDVRVPDKASAAQIRAMFLGSYLRFPTFSAYGLGLYAVLTDVTERPDGLPDKAIWTVHVEADSTYAYIGSFVNTRSTTIPYDNDLLKPVIGGIDADILGFHDCTMLSGVSAGDTETRQIQFYMQSLADPNATNVLYPYRYESMPDVIFNFLDGVNAVYGVGLYGDNWGTVAAPWHATFTMELGMYSII